MMQVDEWLDRLYKQKFGRRTVVVCGSEWGDSGKGGIESALLPHFDACVRVSGGANTGRTRRVTTVTGEEVEFIFHLIPSGWADGMESFVGDRVLIDLGRFAVEEQQLIATLGKEPSAPLYVSPRAPIFLPYHRFLEAHIETCMGAKAVGVTGRGIGPMIACMDLRIGPQISHLHYPDVLREWVKRFWNIFEEVFRKVEPHLIAADEKAGKRGDDVFSLDQFTPDKVTEQLIANGNRIKELVTYDFDSRLLDLARRNVPILIGLTQGWGLHRRGTYPYNSSTEITAPAASYCSSIPMEYIGPIIQVGKLSPTRVGAGHAPTHMWDRRAAQVFPVEHPELFSDLKKHCIPAQREAFLNQMRTKINSGEHTDVDVAQYLMVLLNELGATTKRGREMLWPDLYASACAAATNGADCIALTRIDALSGLNFTLKLGYGYSIDGQPCTIPDFPTPIERYEQVEVAYDGLPIDLRGKDLSGIDDEANLPPQITTLLEKWEKYTGVPVGIASFSGGRGGKVFRKVG